MPDVTVTTEAPVPFGIDAETGMPMPGIEPAALEALTNAPPPTGQDEILERRAALAQESFAVIGDIDGNDLSQTGWGVLFAADVAADVKCALEPLFAHRRSQLGDAPFKVFEGADAPRPGESASQWLARHGVSLHVVDPALGVPYYLLIVGSPEAIPFEFQYGLDIYFAVGRLHFDSADEYRQYAESVVAYETAVRPPTTRQAALFATTHDFDRATQLFTTRVARPLTDGLANQPPLGKRQKFKLQSFIGESATKQTLGNILSGAIPGGTPSLLFSGTHGMGFKRDDARLRDGQGALVCQDWSGFGAIKETDWFAASDVPENAKMHGLVHVLFACYGGGCPKMDNFRRSNGTSKQIAPSALIARLPQKMLAHKNGGALAVIGHVERAWAYAFVSDKGGAQTQGFRDVIGRLLRGERAGQAMDQFNVRWAALSTELADSLNSISHGGTVSDTELSNRWVARDDARNYIIFGDPAVRLREDDMPELA